MQQLLRQALDAAPQPVHGLLGGRGHSVEAVIALHNKPGTDDVGSALQPWHEKGLRLIASYSSEDIPAQDGNLADLPRLIIRTDTKGRIEAKLLAPASEVSSGNTDAFVLEMQEDGGLGLYPSEIKG